MLTNENFFMGFSPLTWIMVLALALTLCIAFYLWFHFSKGFGRKKLYISAAVFLAVCITLHLVMLCNFQSIPTTDSYIVQDQALVLAKNPDSVIDTSISYFARYPNNNLLVILLGAFFRIMSAFGVDNYYLSSIILNSFCLLLSEILLYLAVKKLFGLRVACNYLFISVCSPVMYLTVPWVYSVSLCMPFVAALLYLGSCMFKETRYPYLAAQSVLFAFFAVIGYFIRPIVAIFAIAFFICFLLWFSKSNKKLVKSCLITICCICIAVPAFFTANGFIGRYYQDDSGNFPVTHWIMMGLHTNGSVNAKDQKFTAQFQTKEEKTAANIEEIKSTLKKYGVSGLMTHLAKKHCLTWSEGSADYTARLMQNEVYTPLYDYVAGDRNDLLLLYCQAFRLALYLLTLISLLKQFFSKRITPLFLFTLSLFGGMVFYLLWEAKQSYSIPFLFLLAVLAAHGLGVMDKYIKKRSKPRKVFWGKAALYMISFIILLSTLYVGVARYNDFTQKTQDFQDVSILCCNTSNLKHINNLAKNNAVLLQTFYTNKTFNTLKIQAKKLEGDAGYQIILADEKSNVLFAQTVSGRDVGKDGFLTFSIPEDYLPEQENKYSLTIEKVRGKQDSIGWTYCFSRESDMYQGDLSVGNVIMPYDLMLHIYRVQQAPYTTPVVYIGVMVFILLFEFFCVSFLLKRMCRK